MTWVSQWQHTNTLSNGNMKMLSVIHILLLIFIFKWNFMKYLFDMYLDKIVDVILAVYTHTHKYDVYSMECIIHAFTKCVCSWLNGMDRYMAKRCQRWKIRNRILCALQWFAAQNMHRLRQTHRKIDGWLDGWMESWAMNIRYTIVHALQLCSLVGAPSLCEYFGCE